MSATSSRSSGARVANASFLRVALILAVLFALAGCQATIKEKHFFAFVPAGDADRTPVNFFRLTVKGSSYFSNARYLSGFYDERAVDLFFNEMTRANGSQTLFDQKTSEPGKNDVLTPLDPSEHGTYVLILSTNADAIADTIGAFAESEVVGDSVTQLVNRNALRDAKLAEASATAVMSEASALTSELNARLKSAGEAFDPSTARANYLKAVNLIAHELGRKEDFKDFGDALIWLQAESSP